MAAEGKESGRDDEDQGLVIMREDLISLLQSFKEQVFLKECIVSIDIFKGKRTKRGVNRGNYE